MTASRAFSPRKARICPKPECGRRNFGDLSWRCPEHAVAVDQADHKYFGRKPTLRSEP